MNDLKYTISRSFSRKIPLGQYNMAEFFSSHQEEILVSDFPEIDGLSHRLYQRAKEDVDKAIEEFKNGKIELKAEQEAQANLDFDLSVQEENDLDRSQKLKEANKNLGLK